MASPSSTKFSVLLPELIKEYPDDSKVLPNLSHKASHNRLVVTHDFGPTPHLKSSLAERMLQPDFAIGFADTTKMNCEHWSTHKALFGDIQQGIPSMASSSKCVGWFFTQKKIELVNFETKYVHPDLESRVEELYEMLKQGPIQTLS